MTRRGFVPLDVERLPLVFATHLPGVSADVDGFAIGDIRISKLTWLECSMLEKSQFMDDLQDVFFYGREPFFCVFGGFPGDDSDQVDLLKRNAIIEVLRLTRSLRLLKSGEVWNPLEFILYTRHNSTNSRDPRLFGRMAFESRGERFVHLSMEDIDCLDGLYTAISLFDRFRYDIEIDRAETLLGASYSPAHANHAHRMLPLIGAIEILAGRDLSPLGSAEWADDSIRQWLDAYRSLRNSLAHGRREDALVVSARFAIARDVTRILIREAIAWRLLDAKAQKVTGPALVARVADAEAASAGRLAKLRETFPSMSPRPQN
ncbi:hypothetical protein [Bradyrhizobium guangdongense]|uniref:hypothetical protein n=1 Tax=Bradyrhizobium guangdongense TaxID=1325090 RepID=UPI001128CD19|nr:hypothetical protein [Bradyrhizobium guangdongense]